jgi:hypothetical protein
MEGNILKGKNIKIEIETNKIKCRSKWEQLLEDPIIAEQIFTEDKQICKSEKP